MWHYAGHRQALNKSDRDVYLDEFAPAMIAQYRRHIPSVLLGVGLNLDSTVTQVCERIKAGTWKPYADKNLIYVVGGYGRLAVIMRPDNDKGDRNTWPTDSNNPMWDEKSGEFNIQTLARLAPQITQHSQEGPGLRQNHRTTPIAPIPRQWFVGLLDLYNDVTNGWGIHAWPPSWADEKDGDPLFAKPPNFNESDFMGIVRERMQQPLGTQPSEPEKPGPTDPPSLSEKLATARRLIREAEAALGPNLTDRA
jgi:hypothetical protein